MSSAKNNKHLPGFLSSPTDFKKVYEFIHLSTQVSQASRKINNLVMKLDDVLM
jgi:hypothetical protein